MENDKDQDTEQIILRLSKNRSDSIKIKKQNESRNEKINIRIWLKENKSKVNKNK